MKEGLIRDKLAFKLYLNVLFEEKNIDINLQYFSQTSTFSFNEENIEKFTLNAKFTYKNIEFLNRIFKLK